MVHIPINRPICGPCSQRFHGLVRLGDGVCESCRKASGGEVIAVQTVHESRDNDRAGAGDHDREYIFGQPREHLTLMLQSKLTRLRGRLMDVKDPTLPDQASNPAEGDMDWVRMTTGGLLVPIESHA